MKMNNRSYILLFFSVWRISTKGVHVSEEADLWFAKYLGLEGCKLYCYPEDGVPRKSKLRPQVAEKQFDVSEFEYSEHLSWPRFHVACYKTLEISISST